MRWTRIDTLNRSRDLSDSRQQDRGATTHPVVIGPLLPLTGRICPSSDIYFSLMEDRCRPSCVFRDTGQHRSPGYMVRTEVHTRTSVPAWARCGHPASPPFRRYVSGLSDGVSRLRPGANLWRNANANANAKSAHLDRSPANGG